MFERIAFGWCFEKVSSPAFFVAKNSFFVSITQSNLLLSSLRIPKFGKVVFSLFEDSISR